MTAPKCFKFLLKKEIFTVEVLQEERIFADLGSLVQRLLTLLHLTLTWAPLDSVSPDRSPPPWCSPSYRSRCSHAQRPGAQGSTGQPAASWGRRGSRGAGPRAGTPAPKTTVQRSRNCLIREASYMHFLKRKRKTSKACLPASEPPAAQGSFLPAPLAIIKPEIPSVSARSAPAPAQ